MYVSLSFASGRFGICNLKVKTLVNVMAVVEPFEVVHFAKMMCLISFSLK